jgi:hypothetical protein
MYEPLSLFSLSPGHEISTLLIDPLEFPLDIPKMGLDLAPSIPSERIPRRLANNLIFVRIRLKKISFAQLGQSTSL